HPCDDRGVDVGDVALQRRSAVHHRHAGQADVVLERDALALELAARRALHLALVVPGVVLVLCALGTIAGRARVLHGRHGIGHSLDGVIRGDTATHGLEEERDVGVGQGHAELPADRLELVWSGKLGAGHETPPSGIRRVLRCSTSGHLTSMTYCWLSLGFFLRLHTAAVSAGGCCGQLSTTLNVRFCASAM